MPISFACPHCQAPFTVADQAAGRTVRCGKCGETIVVPAAAKKRNAGRGAKPAADAAAAQVDLSQPVDMSPDETATAFSMHHRGIDDEMDLTPMVDVTFQLLIFFIITAAFSLQKSLEVPKPKQKDTPTQTVQFNPEEDPQYVTVYVDEFNTYRVVTVDMDVEAPSEHELLRKMREARGGTKGGVIPTKLLVKAHPESRHEKVVSALDAGTEVGMEEVQLMTMEET